jgi:hypothetical protein
LIPKDLFRKVLKNQGLRRVFLGFALLPVRLPKKNLSYLFGWRRASPEKRMGGSSDAGIPASITRNRPAIRLSN